MINKYKKEIKGAQVDVYDVLVAFEVTDPAVAHAVKKLLAAGKRGHKDYGQDLKEAAQAIQRAMELHQGTEEEQEKGRRGETLKDLARPGSYAEKW